MLFRVTVFLLFFVTSVIAKSAITPALETPISFEVNEGQTDRLVQYLSRGNGYNLFLTNQEVVLSNRGSVTRLKLIASNSQPGNNGEELLPGKVDYFIGNDPKKWHTNVSTYAKVRYSDVYPGIDVVYYGKEGELEYDFVVKAGADPKQIAFQIEGAEKISLVHGDLVLQTASGELREHMPKIYQNLNDVEHPVAGSYAMLANNTIGFRLEDYDHHQALVIDPVLSYSTYLGGNGFDDRATSIATDATGAVYVSGTTNSLDFPASPALHNSTDIFVTKLSPQGTRVYSIFLGGTGFEQTGGIAVSPSKSVYITGNTDSADFPRVRAIQPNRRGPVDIFVTQLSPSGSTITFSTYLGGTGSYAVGSEQAAGIKLDRVRKIYVFGQTNSRNFPLKNPTQKHFVGGRSDGFLTILTPSGNSIVFSTYVGTKFDDRLSSGTINPFHGDVYLAGAMGTAQFQSPSELVLAHFEPNPAKGLNPFIYRICPVLLWGASYNGPTSKPPAPKLWYSGSQAPSTKSQGHDLSYEGFVYLAIDGCLSKLNESGSCFASGTIAVLDGDLHFLSTFHFNGDIAEITGFTADPKGNLYITGVAGPHPFPLVNPIQRTFRGGTFDAFVMRFSPGATQITFSTFLGGNKADKGMGIAVDPKGNLYVCGQTESPNFPKVHAIQNVKKGFNDAFVVKISP